MKPILIAIALSTGLVLNPAIANQPEVPPRSIQVESDDSKDSQASQQGESAQHHQSIARERQELARPLEELPKEPDRRFKKK